MGKFYRSDFNYLMMGCVPTKFEEWLDENGFFTVPAAKGHHGNYSGGLFDHSFVVATTLRDFTEKLGLKWDKGRSPYIVGMFHDLCKLDDYIVNEDGTIDYADSSMPGHGDKSVMMLAQHLQLTEEEMFCIRWHMGAFDDKANWKYYSKAVAKYPNVLYTHTADMVASQIQGI